jgi:hypothetical protein
MGDISGAHVVQAQSHHATGPEAVFVVSADAERSQHREDEIVAGGPGNIKILWLTPAEAHLLCCDLSNAAVAAEVPRKEESGTNWGEAAPVRPICPALRALETNRTPAAAGPSINRFG